MLSFISFVAATVCGFLWAIAAEWGPDRPEAWAVTFIALGLALGGIPWPADRPRPRLL